MRPLPPKNQKLIILGMFTHLGVVGVLIFVCLVLPGLILRPPASVEADFVSHPTKPVVDWLGFSEAGAPPVEFDPTPPLDVRLGVIRPWPVDPAEEGEMEPAMEANAGWRAKDFDALRWYGGVLSYEYQVLTNGRLHYHLMPSFSFQNNTLQWSGLHIRLWVDF